MATKRLDPSRMTVWVMLPDEPPRPAEVMAKGARSLKRIVQGKESSSCGPEVNCSSGAGVDSANLPLLNFRSTRILEELLLKHIQKRGYKRPMRGWGGGYTEY